MPDVGAKKRLDFTRKTFCRIEGKHRPFVDMVESFDHIVGLRVVSFTTDRPGSI